MVKDPNGDTGIEFLYDNWSKIKWSGGGGMSTQRTDLISKSKKNEIWISKEIVIPAFYRDIHSSKDGGGETPKINKMYSNLIRMAGMIKDRDMFDFSFHSTNFSIQNILVSIYDLLKNMLDKKNGIVRKYLLGKNVDYCVRTVISAPVFNANDPRDNIVDFHHAAIPISQVCVLCYPFMVAWLRNFFEMELIQNKSAKISSNINDNGEEEIIQLKNPEAYFNDNYIKKHIDKFVNDPSSRYDKIEVPTTDNKPHYLIFEGRYRSVDAEKATISKRYMTWTDLLFIASNDITKDKHVMLTRYPLLDVFGVAFSKIRVSSTLHTSPVEINGHIYKWYPVIDLSMPKSQVANNFIDTARFSCAYLKSMDGDFDGDQITVKILWSQEANEECEKRINSKSYLLGLNGRTVRGIELEAIQTLYVLTKNPS